VLKEPENLAYHLCHRTVVFRENEMRVDRGEGLRLWPYKTKTERMVL